MPSSAHPRSPPPRVGVGASGRLIAADAPRFTIVAARACERPVTLRQPFRFGNATLTSALQAFVEVRIRTREGREAAGTGAELMVPRWFDKAADKSPAQNVDDLRSSIVDAVAAYTADRAPGTAFGHTARNYDALMARAGRTRLSSGFGAALVDRAVMDAACRAHDISFVDALRANLPGIDAALATDLDAFDIDAFLAARHMPAAIAVRATIGLLDPIDDSIVGHGIRYFKVKLGGDVAHDVERLTAVARVLDRLPSYAVTLDGNEQFASIDDVESLLDRIRAGVPRLAAAILYVEQPLPRDDASTVGGGTPFLVDEGDDGYDAWPRARRAGYTGVSSKSCKGLYKSIVNAMRCTMWNAAAASPRYFVSGEDLTTQCGVALQQDTALAAVLGITHIERNGHHYVDGFAGEHAPESERKAFLAAHPDLYASRGDNAHLVIRDGALSLASLHCIGFATAARPDLDAMTPLP